LSRFLSTYFQELVVTDDEGDTLASTESGEAASFADKQWWSEAKWEGTYIGDQLEYDHSLGQWVLPVAVEIRESLTGTRRGVSTKAHRYSSPARISRLR